MLLAVCVIVIIQTNDAAFPPNLTKCSMDDGECLKRALQYIITNHYGGVPELGLGAIDPFHIDHASSHDPTVGDTSTFTVNLNVSDSSILGIKDGTVARAEFKTKSKSIKGEFDINFPVLELQGDYKIGGNILNVPIAGDGKYTMNFVEPKMKIKFLGKLVQRGNGEYIELGKFKTRMEINNGSLNFRNLFNGHQILGDTVNQFINDNWQQVFPEFSRPLFDIFSSILKKHCQKVFDTMPVNEFFV